LTRARRHPSLVPSDKRQSQTIVTFVRSFLYMLFFIAFSTVMFIAVLPLLVMPRLLMVRASQAWSRAMFWGLRVIAGCDYEVRGDIPKGPLLFAAKHMSMWDTLALFALIDDVCIVVKRELLSVPFYGWYINKAGVIAVDRAAGASALRRMAVQAKAVFASGRPLAIFPEGTRKKPGAAPDYKPGVAALYSQLEVCCVPVALNSGQFWTGFLKRPGTIVIDFLPAIPAGLKRAEFMRELEKAIETATEKLVAEATAGPSQG
jgi:1-acyl-sn-glycerol-3-phosphate acyltransferase